MTAAQEYNVKFFIMVNLTLIYHNQKARSVTLYAYCLNNQIRYIDPTGMSSQSMTSTFVNNNDIIIEHRDDGDPMVYRVDNVSEWLANGKKKDGLNVIGKEFPWFNYSNMIGKKYFYYPISKNMLFEDNIGWLMEYTYKKIGIWDFIRNEDQILYDYVRPWLSGLVQLAPNVSLTNSIIILSSGKDMYANKATIVDKGLSIIDIVTFGLGSEIKTGVKNVSDYINDGINIISGGKTTYEETKK
jgi:hypothetical protein